MTSNSIALKALGNQKWEFRFNGQYRLLQGGLDSCIQEVVRQFNEAKCIERPKSPESDTEAILGAKNIPKLSDVIMGDLTWEGKQG
jgi:hypothetical protein